MAFQKAIKAQAKGRIALAGPSGSGKTFTALAIASHMCKRIAFLDTEHGSASKYADLFEFDVMEMDAPYHPEKYMQAIEDAGKAGYEILIIDSLSHAWSGTGGVLDIATQIEKRMKNPNSYTAWKDATPIQNKLIESMIAAPLHLIVTMRSKQEYVMDKDNNGKTQIRKVGMAPVQREGMEYEFDVFADINLDHELLVTKSRCHVLADGLFPKAGKEFAEIFSGWLQGEKAISVPKAKLPGEGPDASEYEGREGEYPLPQILHKDGKEKLSHLHTDAISKLVDWCEGKPVYAELQKAATAYALKAAVIESDLFGDPASEGANE